MKHRCSVDVPPSIMFSDKWKRDSRKEERSRDERHRSDKGVWREEGAGQHEERAKNEDKARRNSSEKDKERVLRYDDKNKPDERI